MYAEILETTKLDSRTKIQYSLMSLMEQYPYSDITISQICQTAKLSRQTFYRLFDVKEDVLLAELNRIMQEYEFSKTLLEENTKIKLYHFFLFFAGYQKLLAQLHENNYMHLLQHALSRHCDSLIYEPIFRIPHGYDYATEFISSTLCSVLTVWAKMKFKTSCSTLALYTSDFLKGV